MAMAIVVMMTTVKDVMSEERYGGGNHSLPNSPFERETRSLEKVEKDCHGEGVQRIGEGG